MTSMAFASPYSLNGKSDPYCEFKKVGVQKVDCTPTISVLISVGPWEKLMHDPNAVFFVGRIDLLTSTITVQRINFMRQANHYA